MVLTPIDYDAWARAGLKFAIPEGTPSAPNVLPAVVNDISSVESGSLGEDKLDEFQLGDEGWEMPSQGNY